MDVSTLIRRTRPFQILEVLGAIFIIFFTNFNRNFCKQTMHGERDQTPRFAASDLVLHCLPISNKNDAMLILVN